MKISLIEFDYHPEVLRNTLKILDGASIEVLVFTSAKIWKQADWKKKELRVEPYLWDEKQALDTFLKANLEILNSSDLLLFNTVASHFKVWNALALKPPRFLRIHNGHANFKSWTEVYKPILTPFFLWKDFSHFVRKILGERENFHQNKFIAKTQYFAFPDQVIRDYAVKNLGVKAEQALSLPFSFWEEEDLISSSKTDLIQISIIGKVDPRNRDYELVLEAVKKALPELKAQGKTIQLCLLGKAIGAYADRIVHAFKQLENENFRFRSFNGFIPQDEFEKEVAKSSYLLIPTRAHTRFTIYQERYGYSKISGNINDLIRYHRKALIQSDYPLSEALSPLFEKYLDADDLAEHLTKLNSKPEEGLDFKKLLADYERTAMQKHYLSTFQALIKDTKTK